jgi:hypothetical protein
VIQQNLFRIIFLLVNVTDIKQLCQGITFLGLAFGGLGGKSLQMGHALEIEGQGKNTAKNIMHPIAERAVYAIVSSAPIG